MTNYWHYLNEANRQWYSLSDAPPSALPWLLKTIRWQLSLRYEKRSLAFVDDDSIILYDRWNRQEVWAWIPTFRDPHYYLTELPHEEGRISPKDVSVIFAADAFSLNISSLRREAFLGLLYRSRDRIASLPQSKLGDPSILGSVISDIINPICITTVERADGFDLLLSKDDSFAGLLRLIRGRRGWTAEAGDLFVGMRKNTQSTDCLTVLPERGAHDKLIVKAAEYDNEAIVKLRHWIEETIAMTLDVQKTSFKYDVAISFAGEDRDIAKAIAEMLVIRGYSVFYDEYEAAELWGKDLYQHLSNVYSEQAKYCMILVSKAYVERLWTKHELRQAQARAFTESKEYILPVRIDDAKVPGLLDTVGYVRLDRLGVGGVVDLLEQKLNPD